MSLAADTPISTPAMKGAWLVRAIWRTGRNSLDVSE